MSETRICQHTGIEFQGSARQKNHPRVSEFLTGAHKSDEYALAKQVLGEVKSAGMLIVEAVALAELVIETTSRAKHALVAHEERRRKEQAKTREANHRLMGRYGFHQVDAPVNNEDSIYGAGIGERERWIKVWVDENGHEVTVSEALARIEAKQAAEKTETDGATLTETGPAKFYRVGSVHHLRERYATATVIAIEPDPENEGWVRATLKKN